MSISLDVPFKGERTYLQSADILNALLAKTGANQNIELKFTKLLTSSIEALPAADVEEPAKASARFRATGPQGAIDLVIRPTSISAPIARVPYDEASVIASSILKGRTIEDSNIDSATPTERMVALNKRLINEVVSPGRKLLFTNIHLKHIPASAFLRLELQSQVGKRFFHSTIFGDDQELGSIYFYGV